jgi:hypothetical protein
MYRAYLAKVDFIKDDLVGVCDGIEAGCESEEGDDSKSELVVPVIRGGLLGLTLELSKVFAGLVNSTIDLLFGDGRWPLLGARRRRHDASLMKVKKSACRSETKHHPHTRLMNRDVEG